VSAPTRPAGVLTAREYAYADAEITKALGLPAREGGYGLLFCTDDDGRHWTRAGDPAVSLMLANGVEVDGQVVGDAFPHLIEGWPDDPDFIARVKARNSSRGRRPLSRGGKRGRGWRR